MQQLSLELQYQPSYLEANFQVGLTNREAYYTIKFNLDWPKWGMVIHGPAGCGKTYLAKIWQQRHQAFFINPDFFASPTIDWQTIINNRSEHYIIDFQKNTFPFNQNLYLQNFLHLLNQFDEKQYRLLVCTQENPIAWSNIELMDLKSRQQAMLNFHIAEPEEDLFRRITQQMLFERGIMIPDYQLSFLSVHAERSYKSIHYLVYQIYQQVLTYGSTITINHLKNILSHFPSK